MMNLCAATHLFALRRRKMISRTWHREPIAPCYPMIAITDRTPNGIGHFDRLTPVSSAFTSLLWRSSSNMSGRLAGARPPVLNPQFFPDDRHKNAVWRQTLEIPWPRPMICRLMAIIWKGRTHVMVITGTLEHHPSCGVSFPLDTIRHRFSSFCPDGLRTGHSPITWMPLWRPSGDPQSAHWSTASCSTGLSSPKIHSNPSHRDFPVDRHKSLFGGPASSRRSPPRRLWRAFGKNSAPYGERLEKKLQFPYQSQKNSS